MERRGEEGAAHNITESVCKYIIVVEVHRYTDFWERRRWR